ncbi:transcription factor [Salvia divinorum]|uniref:Transcription factor n=1 Tax=Salvia divinorum TaxID=28513 RepID=A0ABD1FKP7_SALDI
MEIIGSMRANSGSSSTLRLSLSLSEDSNRLWRETDDGVFRRSTRDEDDEEALKWAVLEKLPTVARLRRGILVGSKGAQDVDVHDLGDEDKKKLVERLVSNVEIDNEKFLRRLKSRIDRVGIDLPTIEVRYEHLNIDAEAYVASRALPTFINFYINNIEGLLSFLRIIPSRKKPLCILKDVSGIIKPHRLTLLLGPPSSGKTTFLLALAGRLDSDIKFSGRVTYNGHEMDEFVPQKTAAYISQHDMHLGDLTVKETLAFSARCQGVGSRYEMLAELLRREKVANIKPDPNIDMFMKAAATEGDEANVVTEYILKVLGLDICADTIVGNEMLRGISGGQRKRVTTGEMLVGPSNALFMDEISTGLDSSTTFQIINMLRQYVHIMEGTACISLLQPAPETYDLFDDIVLLSDGHVVYQGPREYVLEFFESMGFKCPDRKGVADFLQEVTSRKDQQQYWAAKEKPYRFVSGRDFAEAFQSSVVGRRLGEELAVPYDKSKNHPAALTTKKYSLGNKELLKACAQREILWTKRNSFVYSFKIFQLCTMAAVTMGMFFRTRMSKDNINDGGIYTGVLFYTVIIVMFNGMSEIAMTIRKLPVFYKQRNMFFFPAWVYGLPPWFLSIPTALLEVGLWTGLTHYVIGLDPNVRSFVKQYLLLIFINQTSGGLFRFMGSAGRNMIVANTIGMFALLMFFALGGFVLSRNNVKKWWLWGYWSSPLMYAQNAILVNEFTGHSWSKDINGTKLGVLVMESRGFFPESYWYWIGFGACIGFMFLFNFCNLICLTYLNAYDKKQAVLPEEHEEGVIRTRAQAQVGGTISTGTSSTAIEANANQTRGMILPFEPHSLTFNNVRYAVDMPAEMKALGANEDKLVLLKEVSGAFRPGVLTALMGVSGAGKTTLMDVLAGRKTGGYIEGDIKISGYPKKQETFARVSGYCEQNDIHSPNVTVHESLTYSAWLRLAAEVNAKTRKMFVEEVMELVELTSLRGALVGLPGITGLSTEQRKRLTIAVELVANPSIIFMDEPTSGLDARAAAIVMRTVRNTVNTGRTVVCTIHQPSIDIFEAFDELFLLKRGGEEIYVGPLGHNSTHLINYFEGIEGVAKIKDGYNPATWMLEVTSSAQELQSGSNFADLYKNSDLYMRNKALINELSVPRPGTKDIYFPSQFSQPFLTQCKACLWKQQWSYWRNTPYTAVRFACTTFIAIMFGTIFWDLGSKTDHQQDLFNAMGSMFSSISFLGFQYGSTVQPVVTIERTVFYREKAAGMYSDLPYALSQVLIEIPYVFVQSIIYGLTIYAMIGFDWTAEKFFWFLYFLFITLLFFVLYGMMTVAVTPNQTVASISSSFFYGLWNLFSGFIVPRPRMPVYFRWYSWLNPTAYSLYGIIVTQFGKNQNVMESGETVEQFLRDYFGFKRKMVGFVASMLLLFVITFTLIFAFAIKTLNFQRR